MKERPILFSTDMVQAILAGKKTMTRRLSDLNKINKNPDEWGYLKDWVVVGSPSAAGFIHIETRDIVVVKSPCGQPGDILYVRETWQRYYEEFDVNQEVIRYAADNPEPIYEIDGDGFRVLKSDGTEKFISWKPSIHMPKDVARIWLKVTDVRVERLQDITEEDARKEGVYFYGWEDESQDDYKNYLHGDFDDDWGVKTAKESFYTLWGKINSPDSWNENPWVWVVSFEVLSTTGKPEQ